MVDLKKLEIQLDSNHEHLKAFLQTIQETVDHLVEESKDHGEMIEQNTKSLKMMEVDVESLRKKIDKFEGKVETAAETGAKNGAKEAVPTAVKRFIEPAKKKYNLKTSRFSRLKFWRRG